VKQDVSPLNQATDISTFGSFEATRSSVRAAPEGARRQYMKMNRSQFVTGSAQVLELVCPERILRWAITACRRDKLMVLATNSVERAPSVIPAEYRSRFV
jgi:hypothetical protein